MIDRRSFLALGFPLAAYALVGPGGALAQAWARNFGPPAPFSFERLRERAAAMAHSDHHPRHSPAGDIIRKIDFDAVQKIQYRPDHTLWQDDPGAFPVRFFHLHTFVPEPVRINVVEGGDAREFLYSTRHFDYGDTGLDEILPSGMGYAGFRVMADREGRTDWLAFQGASYFRTSGAEDQYGASARGIAVNTGLETPEEFPDFTEFWLEPAAGKRHSAILSSSGR